MKSEINHVEVPTPVHQRYVKNQLVIYEPDHRKTVLMLLTDEDEDGIARVVCLYSSKNTGDWWEIGEVYDRTNVCIMKLFTDTLTLSN